MDKTYLNLYYILVKFVKKVKQLSEQQSSMSGLNAVRPDWRRPRTWMEVVDFAEGKKYHLYLLVSETHVILCMSIHR